MQPLSLSLSLSVCIHLSRAPLFLSLTFFSLSFLLSLSLTFYLSPTLTHFLSLSLSLVVVVAGTLLLAAGNAKVEGLRFCTGVVKLKRGVRAPLLFCFFSHVEWVVLEEAC